MQNKAKIVAVSGVCGGVSAVCLLLLGLPGVSWAGLILAVVASVAVAIPTMLSGKAVFSLIIYIVSSIIGVLTGIANILYVAPVVTFCLPMALVKVSAETPKVTANLQQTTVDDPFGNGDDKQVVAVELTAKPRMRKFVKWLLYYVVLEIGIALTLLTTYLFAKPTFELVVNHKLFVVLMVAFQLLPFAYNLLLTGSFNMVAKILKRHVKQ